MLILRETITDCTHACAAAQTSGSRATDGTMNVLTNFADVSGRESSLQSRVAAKEQVGEHVSGGRGGGE